LPNKRKSCLLCQEKIIESNIISKLQQILGKEGVLTTHEDLYVYSYDGNTLFTHMPDVVVLPTSVDQISLILKLANENLIPVTARGAGTNSSGGSIPIKGGIVLCTTRMNKILEVNKGNLTAIVEPGLVLHDFNMALAKEDLFYPPDPQSFLSCTIGGTVAENAGGPYGIKYGVTKHYLLGLEVVLASGTIVNLGGMTVKNRSGYDLPVLFAGSEGTLGIISKIIVRLLPKPPAQKSMRAVFNNITTAGQAVSDILAKGIVPAKIEFLDDWFIKRIEELHPIGLPIDSEALLLIQCDGNQATVESEIQEILTICLKCGAKSAKVAEDNAEADMLWRARQVGFAALFKAAPTILGDDITVPRDKIALFMDKLKQVSEKHRVPIRTIGHVGDGNLHPSIPTDIADKEHFNRAAGALEDLLEAALSFQGVISGEHGIGLEKKRYLKKALDPHVIDMMKNIKDALDPNHILNPGKIWEE